MNTNKPITEIDLQDAPRIYDRAHYADGEIFFADNITSIPNLARVFKVNFHAFVFCIDGDLSLNINGSPYKLHANHGLFVDTNTIIENLSHGADFRCVICAFAGDAIFNFINKSLFEVMMRIKNHPVIEFTPDEITLMVKYYELAKFKMEHPELNLGKEAMLNILRSYAYDLLSNMSRHLDVEDGAILRQGDKLFRRFVLMLTDSRQQGRSVKAYADELCVSPKYLTAICHQHAGRTASELIAHSMVGHIKQMLLYSDMSIKEIAVHLGFSNLSFFGKYVKKHLGLSPVNFRRQHGYGK